MTLYCKAGPDGTAVGDCPFCHSVRLVLEELNIDYDLSYQKPIWLVDHYEGKLPALRHRKECYTESSVIADYLLFFFGKNNQQFAASTNKQNDAVSSGLFPVMAAYLKHTPDNDEQDHVLRDNVQIVLQQFDDHLMETQHYWNGENWSLTDCQLAPQLYHLQCSITAFDKQLDLTEYTNLSRYMTNVMARPSFQATLYSPETVEWGWSNARQSSQSS